MESATANERLVPKGTVRDIRPPPTTRVDPRESTDVGGTDRDIRGERFLGLTYDLAVRVTINVIAFINAIGLRSIRGTLTGTPARSVLT